MTRLPYSPLYHLFFFNDTATTEIYPLSLHDALPISENANPIVVMETNKGTVKIQLWADKAPITVRSEEHTSELQSPDQLVCRLLLEKKKRLRAGQQTS